MTTQLIPNNVTSKQQRFMVYIDQTLKEDAEKLAKLEKRSLSNLVNVLLQKAVDDAKARGDIE